jgi:hypothetical protein
VDADGEEASSLADSGLDSYHGLALSAGNPDLASSAGIPDLALSAGNPDEVSGEGRMEICGTCHEVQPRGRKRLAVLREKKASRVRLHAGTQDNIHAISPNVVKN